MNIQRHDEGVRPETVIQAVTVSIALVYFKLSWTIYPLLSFNIQFS